MQARANAPASTNRYGRDDCTAGGVRESACLLLSLIEANRGSTNWQTDESYRNLLNDTAARVIRVIRSFCIITFHGSDCENLRSCILESLDF